MSLRKARKKPVTDRLFQEPGNSLKSALQGADVLPKATFMPRCLVLVDQTLAGRFIDHRNGHFVGGFGCLCITSTNSLDNILDMRAQHGALAGIAFVAIVRLAGALTGLGSVCQWFSPASGSKEPATMRFLCEIVNLKNIRGTAA